MQYVWKCKYFPNNIPKIILGGGGAKTIKKLIPNLIRFGFLGNFQMKFMHRNQAEINWPRSGEPRAPYIFKTGARRLFWGARGCPGIFWTSPGFIICLRPWTYLDGDILPNIYYSTYITQHILPNIIIYVDINFIYFFYK